MAKYQIWDKTSQVIVPTGKVFTAQQWMEQYPVAAIPSMDIVLAGGVINGGFFAVYDAFVQLYKDQGCDFEGCESQQDCLDRIEQFEDERNKPDPSYVSPEERMAAALEAQVMMALPNEA